MTGPDESFRVHTGERMLTTNRAYRMNPGHRRRILREWKQATSTALMVARLQNRRFTRLRIDLTGVYPKGRLPDPGALHPVEKAIIDQIVWTGLIPDDSAAHCTVRPLDPVRNPAADCPLVVVELYSVDPDPDHPQPCGCRAAYEASQRHNQPH